MRQKELFAVEEVTAPIPGFSLERDYLTREEEKELIENVDSQPWESDFLRRIQQYGLGYGADLGETLTWLRDFPPWLQLLANRVSRDAFDRPAENCVINEYIPPQGIGPHRDYRAFGPVVACVSLGSDIVINFTEPERKLSVPVIVPARSFWKIEGEARSKWLHGIPRRLNDMIEGERRPRSRRISITFRTAKR